MAYTDNVNELIISQDEICLVCQTLMGIILDQGLQPLMEEKLKEASIQPGFAQRALEIQDKFSHERRKLMASGEIR